MRTGNTIIIFKVVKIERKVWRQEISDLLKESNHVSHGLF
jgi:hypothetical protein